MKSGIVGSLWILQRLPWWVIGIGGPLCTTGVIWLLRIIFERRLYDYYLASFPGDCFLFAYLLCVKVGVETQKSPWKGFFVRKGWHWLVLVSATLITAWLYGIALAQGGARARFTLLPANVYHFFVELALGYAVPSSFPVIVMAKSTLLRRLAVLCIIVYICLLAYDIAMGNLRQHVR